MKRAARHPVRKLVPIGLALLVAGVLASACGPGDEPEAAPPTRSAGPGEATRPASAPSGATAVAEAQKIFATRCAACHGAQGAGDGPGSAGLTPAPRNLQDPDWQDGVTDDHIEKIILYGGAAVGRSPAMPANPDLLAKKPVVVALREHIRALTR